MTSLTGQQPSQRNSSDPIDSTTKLHTLLHILLQNGRQRPHVFKLLRQHRTSLTQERGRPFIKMLVEILNRTEEEAHASGKDSSVEGLIGFEATELLYEVLRVKRLSKDELGTSICANSRNDSFIVLHNQAYSRSASLRISSRLWSRLGTATKCTIIR